MKKILALFLFISLIGLNSNAYNETRTTQNFVKSGIVSELYQGDSPCDIDYGCTFSLIVSNHGTKVKLYVCDADLNEVMKETFEYATVYILKDDYGRFIGYHFGTEDEGYEIIRGDEGDWIIQTYFG